MKLKQQNSSKASQMKTKKKETNIKLGRPADFNKENEPKVLFLQGGDAPLRIFLQGPGFPFILSESLLL